MTRDWRHNAGLEGRQGRSPIKRVEGTCQDRKGRTPEPPVREDPKGASGSALPTPSLRDFLPFWLRDWMTTEKPKRQTEEPPGMYLKTTPRAESSPEVTARSMPLQCSAPNCATSRRQAAPTSGSRSQSQQSLLLFSHWLLQGRAVISHWSRLLSGAAPPPSRHSLLFGHPIG